MCVIVEGTKNVRQKSSPSLTKKISQATKSITSIRVFHVSWNKEMKRKTKTEQKTKLYSKARWQQKSEILVINVRKEENGILVDFIYCELRLNILLSCEPSKRPERKNSVPCLGRWVI